MIPDFYDSLEKCLKNRYNIIQTNPRYKNFKQRHYTAGDDQQFFESFDKSNLKNFNIEIDDFKQFELWGKFQNIHNKSVKNTFNYLFNKFKKGIFVKIIDNKLKVFIPFSKNKFQNEWADKVKIDKTKFRNLNDFIRESQELEDRIFKSRYVNQHIGEWYANNSIFRYEFPCQEGDSGIPMISDMFKELCKHRKLPDIELFINKRDFPLFNKHGYEPYNHIFGETKLLSHNYDKYCPILSMVEHKNFADISMPTWYDWDRVTPKKFFPNKPVDFNFNFSTPWSNKKEIAIFRGASTGSIDNIRIKACLLSKKTDLLNAGITKWNCRPRIQNDKSTYLQLINKHNLKLVDFISPDDQSQYKYVLNIPGHVCAYRLSLELSMGSVVLLVNNQYKLWFQKFLKPTIISEDILGDYIPVKEDLSNLLEIIQWCKDNDEKAKIIANNALKFHKKYLTKDGILNYLQFVLVNIKNQVGSYKYPDQEPLYYQLINQKEILTKIFQNYPQNNLNNLTNSIDKYHHPFSINRALQWILQIKDCEKLIHIISKKKIIKGSFMDKLIVIKKVKNIHQSFIGITAINPITKLIPNFMYTYAYKNNTNYSEYISDYSFLDFLLSDNFNFPDYLSILMQISLALHVAQQETAFTHLDLYPWNIMLKILEHPQTIHYRITNSKFIKINTKIIPVIIDYGRSQVFYKGKMHGYSAPPLDTFKISKFHDILTLLISSLSTILRAKYNTKLWFVIGKNKWGIIKLANFIKNSKYTKYESFHNLYEIRRFSKFAKNLSNLLQKENDELDKKTPLEFFNYCYNFNQSSLEFSCINPYFNLVNHSRKIFDECFGIKYNLFEKFQNITLPKSENLLEMYYAYESLKINLRLFYEDNPTLKDQYDKHIIILDEFYQPIIDKLRPEKDYNKIDCEIPINLLEKYENIDYFEWMTNQI